MRFRRRFPEESLTPGKMTTNHTFLPDKAYARELIRPWKLITFFLAVSLLLCGAVYYNIADWDIGVTLLMGGLT